MGLLQAPQATTHPAQGQPRQQSSGQDVPKGSQDRGCRSKRIFGTKPALQEAGLALFPAASPRRAGSIEDLNNQRISKTVNQAFLNALPVSETGPFSPKQVQALIQTFFATRTGLNGEDLRRRLERPEPEGDWCRLCFIGQRGGYHGSHLEALHSLTALGRLLPSAKHIAGTRYVDARQGVYLHQADKRSKAEGYATHVATVFLMSTYLC